MFFLVVLIITHTSVYTHFLVFFNLMQKDDYPNNGMYHKFPDWVLRNLSSLSFFPPTPLIEIS